MQTVRWFDMRFALPGPWPEKNFATDIELQDDNEDEWTREPEPSDPDEPLSHVGTPYEKEPAPRWTTREPQWPGLYFVRRDGGATRVAEVFAEGRRLFYEWSDLPTKPVLGSGLEWSDRAIQEPR